MTAELVFFYLIGAAAMTTALLMILQRNPVMSAIYLIGNFFCIAALYLLLRAQFLAVIQVIVYTGAIMVLVVFVIMLLNLEDEQKLTEQFSVAKVIGTVLATGLLLEMLFLFGIAGVGSAASVHPEAVSTGTAHAIGDALFGRFLLPFEITSVLLLAAIVGAVVLAKKRT